MNDGLDNSGDQGTLGVIEEMGKWNQGWVDGGIIRTTGLKGGRRDSEGEERWGQPAFASKTSASDSMNQGPCDETSMAAI